jgi:hypothetical protein
MPGLQIPYHAHLLPSTAPGPKRGQVNPGTLFLPSPLQALDISAERCSEMETLTAPHEMGYPGPGLLTLGSLSLGLQCSLCSVGAGVLEPICWKPFWPCLPQLGLGAM